MPDGIGIAFASFSCRPPQTKKLLLLDGRAEGLASHARRCGLCRLCLPPLEADWRAAVSSFIDLSYLLFGEDDFARHRKGDSGLKVVFCADRWRASKRERTMHEARINEAVKRCVREAL